MSVSNVVGLAEHRVKRGLPPVAVRDARSPLERVIARYLKHDICRERGVKPTAAFRLIASSCAKSIVRWADREGRPVDDAARFQFYAVGSPGQEVLQVRVSLVGAPMQTMEFEMNCETLEAVPLTSAGRQRKGIKPLLTLPMSLFYRLR